MTRCPKCRSDLGSTVKESRKYGDAVYRRRVCKCCGQITVTAERPVERMPPGLHNAKLTGEAGKEL